MSAATNVVRATEPQHEGLVSFVEHGQVWVNCRNCGKDWSVNGDAAEVVTEGDGYCEEDV